MLGAVFLWPLGASVVASFARDGQWTLGNYGTVARLYARDVAYTVGVAAAGTALTFLVAIPVCGWLRVRAYGPIEFLLKVPLFVPFVVVGHALRVVLEPVRAVVLLVVGRHRGRAGLEAPRGSPRSCCWAPSAAPTTPTSRRRGSSGPPPAVSPATSWCRWRGRRWR